MMLIERPTKNNRNLSDMLNTLKSNKITLERRKLKERETKKEKDVKKKD